MASPMPEIFVSPPSPRGTQDLPAWPRLTALASPPASPQAPEALTRRKSSHVRAKSFDVSELRTAHVQLNPEPAEHKPRASLEFVRRGVARTRKLGNRASFEISRLPSLRTLEGDTQDKRVHWGELFGDLMYIVAVQALGNRFAHHATLLQSASFIGLYLAVYWSWCGEVMYLDRFETNDLLHRVALFVEMVGVMFMVIALSGTDDQLSLLFPISYIIIRMLFVILYTRIALGVRPARKLALVHAIILSVCVAIWLGSIWVPQPWNFILWGLAILLDLLLPVITYNMEKSLPLNTSHMGERLGLFIIIDLGEMVLATVRGLGDHLYAGPAVLSIFYGISIAYSCWWLYFDEAGFTIGTAFCRQRYPIPHDVSIWSIAFTKRRQLRMNSYAGKRPKVLMHALQRHNWISKFWFYNHFFLNISLTTVGVGLELIVLDASKTSFGHRTPANARWIFAAGLILFLTSLGGVHLAHHGLELKQKAVKAAFRVGGALVGLTIAAAAGQYMRAWVFVLIFLLINVAQILFDLLFHESWVIRAADRRKALAKAMQEKLQEGATVGSETSTADSSVADENGRRSLDEIRTREHASPRRPSSPRFSLDLPRRPAEV